MKPNKKKKPTVHDGPPNFPDPDLLRLAQSLITDREKLLRLEMETEEALEQASRTIARAKANYGDAEIRSLMNGGKSTQTEAESVRCPHRDETTAVWPVL